MIDGVINIYKEKGFTSHDVVAKLRGILHQKKIGHTGTLDPEAVGVLPVCLGKGTKLCDMLTDRDKTYETVLHLGIVTDTQDMTGKVQRTCDTLPKPAAVSEAVESFLGEQMQVPPMYSALKVGGKKLYELAREGIEVERKARKVTFYQLEILDMELPLVHIRVKCSKGTYIRTLCHDIGAALGCGGCMESLVRTQVGRFALEDSLTLAQVEACVREGSLGEHVHTIEEMFSHLEAFRAKAQGDKLLANGNPLPAGFSVDGSQPSGQVRMYDSTGRFIGIYRYQEEKDRYFPDKIFI
ncbi:MAG: tRNA pseudouridine(55) synthase TruB [Blautia sp.]|jgi:tRNA pseudouridine55 synthase